MARPLRIEYAEAHYHVTNRWNQRMTVYHKKAEYRLFLEKSRYVHLNPVRVRGYRHRSVKERRAHLRRFPWSSDASYIGLRSAPEWLTMEPVLSEWSGSMAERMRHYRRHVEEGLPRELKSPYAGSAEQSIVGSDSFVEWPNRSPEMSLPAKRMRHGTVLVVPEVAVAQTLTDND